MDSPVAVAAKPLRRKEALPAFADPVLIAPPTRRWYSSSWVVSLGLHLLIVAILLFWIRTQPRGPVGFSDQPFITLGVSRPGPGAVGTGAGGTNAIDTIVDEEPIGAATSSSTNLTLPASAPLQTPQSDAAVVASGMTRGVGPGVPAPSGGLPDARDLVQGGIIGRGGTNNAPGGKGGTGLGAEGAGGSGLPGTAFFGTKDQGTRVVFVIDCSASMENYGAMASAKAALVAALQTLSDEQQFQIVFYNRVPRMFQPFAQDKETLFFATERNKSLARQYISQIVPDQGTDHMPALEQALRLQPEIIYFLTDADEPQLTARELMKIDRVNNGRARIHTIEFGKGNDLGLENFLKKMARQNGGTYRYHDVRQLAAQP
ncbi:MAG TPA: VWA domain-containing protein [Planctomycetaceae bacterium]|nr:VWA domain-containing protein [Planctomycetaceae bacterium]